MDIISAQQCASIEEVRASIDAIDFEIIKLFALRAKFVDAVVQFKTDEQSLVALDRQKEVIDNVGHWAQEQGLDKETFQEIYQLLIKANIGHERTLLQQRTPAK